MSAGHHARDRESTSRRPLVIGLVVLAAVLAALITREAVSSDEAAACTSRPEATIVAAPGLAPALKDVAAAMTEEGRCSRITVKAQESSRSEEHTSELQSLMRISYAVFCLQKKTNKSKQQHIRNN